MAMRREDTTIEFEPRDPREKAEKYLKANKIHEILQVPLSFLLFDVIGP